MDIAGILMFVSGLLFGCTVAISSRFLSDTKKKTRNYEYFSKALEEIQNEYNRNLVQLGIEHGKMLKEFFEKQKQQQTTTTTETETTTIAQNVEEAVA
ncbi:MAG: hypothetical protein FWC33_03335 [Candidatus Bathyarchaeota archaeon]|nr:hypothetical protein [Candidatus Termiticorpusculum sp.]